MAECVNFDDEMCENAVCVDPFVTCVWSDRRTFVDHKHDSRARQVS